MPLVGETRKSAEVLSGSGRRDLERCGLKWLWSERPRKSAEILGAFGRRDGGIVLRT